MCLVDAVLVFNQSTARSDDRRCKMAYPAARGRVGRGSKISLVVFASKASKAHFKYRPDKGLGVTLPHHVATARTVARFLNEKASTIDENPIEG